MADWIFTTPNYMKSKAGREYLLWLSIIIGALFFASVLYLGYFSTVEPLFLTVIFWIINVVFFIWAGNRFISKQLDKIMPWEDFVSKRFFVQLFSSGIYSLLVVNILYYVFRIAFIKSAPEFSQIAVMNIYGLLFVLPAISIHFGVYFLTQWKRTKLRSEQLEKENIRTQLEALKSHIDPHFLFNNLNILSALIDDDKATARTFLDNFADVYRYVLKNKQLELVSLKEELEFLDAYVFLLRKRFGENLHFQTDVFCNTEQYMVPPLSLQIVVENVLKHNKLDDNNPLHIDLFIEGEKLVIKNNLQVKSNVVNSNKTGLSNIKKRFAYLSEEQLEVLNIESHFIVKIPLLEHSL